LTFSQKLYQKIKSFKNEIAISLGDARISYQTLNDTALKVARLFNENNFHNSVVGIVGQRNFSVYYGILGSIYAGCTYVPINEKYTKDRIIKIIEESGITILIGNKKSITSINCAIKETDIKVVLLPEEEHFQEKDILQPDINYFNKSDLLSLKGIPPKEVSSSHIFYILFTSGSTGNPKGVMITDKNLEVFINNFSQFYKLPVGYKASQTFDLSFDLSVVDTFFTWINGGELCILNHSELIMPVEYLKREKLNFWFSVPTLASFIHKMNFLKENSFPDLKYSLFCGESLPKGLADAWQEASPNSSIENYYGPTEATVSVSRYLYKKESQNNSFNNEILPIGKIFFDHSFAIVDEKFNTLKKGEKGQLVIKGKQLAKGYINDIEKTNKVFKKMPWEKSNDNWYLTGDIAFLNDSNEIEYIGRIDNQLKIAGRRVEAGEIEAAILKSNLIKDIVIVPKKDLDGSVKSLIGFTTSQVSNDKRNDINKRALKYIEKLFLPSKIIVIEKMPETTSGKTDRKKLFNIAQSL
tara:strand:- start:706 stop:2283 length:1578 start_codon:yes stop_codon:yes gene_type:complete